MGFIYIQCGCGVPYILYYYLRLFRYWVITSFNYIMLLADILCCLISFYLMDTLVIISMIYIIDMLYPFVAYYGICFSERYGDMSANLRSALVLYRSFFIYIFFASYHSFPLFVSAPMRSITHIDL